MNSDSTKRANINWALPVIPLLSLLAVFLMQASPAPVSAIGQPNTTVSVGVWHTCALTDASSVKCWGWNDFGQLGDGTTTGSGTPVDVCADASCTAPLTGVTAVAAGGGFSSGHTCALTTGGGVKCWGHNNAGQLGDGTTTDRTAPVDVCADATCTAPLTNIVALSAGSSYVSGRGHTCALTAAARVKCWGDNAVGQLGDGTTTNRTTPVDVCADATCAAPLSGVSSISAGGRGIHTCALTSAQTLKCWGWNAWGQLGQSTTEICDGTSCSTTPVDACADATCATLLTNVAAVSAGVFHTCALTTAEAVKCWGRNDGGELGDGTTTTSGTPVDVCADAACAAPLTGAATVSVGVLHTCALTVAEAIKCWGANGGGQLGDGTATNRTTPVDVCADAACAASLTGATAVSAGGAGSHTCALTGAGGVKCWGWNNQGQVGDGTTTNRTTPVDVAQLDAKAPTTPTPTPTPPPPVGGIGFFPDDVDGTPLETGGSSGTIAGVLAGVIAAVAAGAVALGGAAWYLRRQRLRR